MIAALLMIGIVLIQESKGGGLASRFSGYNQIGGVRKTTDFIEDHLGPRCLHGHHQRGLCLRSSSGYQQQLGDGELSGTCH